MLPIEVNVCSSIGFRTVKRIVEGTTSSHDDAIAIEAPLEIRLHYHRQGKRVSRSLVTTMRTPGNDRELALGFLHSEGVIQSLHDVRLVHACRRGDRVRVYLAKHVIFNTSSQRRFLSNSSCGVCGTTSLDHLPSGRCLTAEQGPFVEVETIFSLPAQLSHAQVAFQRTGGLHAAGLATSSGELFIVREDVGRHNALDKVIGSQLAAGTLSNTNSILMMSSRASFELVQKASLAGIAILATVGAPTTLAIDMAVEMNMTLVGFVRSDRFNIYSHPHRILGI